MLDRVLHRGGIGRSLGRLAIGVAGFPIPRDERSPAGSTPSTTHEFSQPLFEVFTFVTDEAQYSDMLRSFGAVGLKPPAASFVRLDDGRSGGPGLDPYTVIARMPERDQPRYVILCHQDVRADLGAGLTELLAVLAELDSRDGTWAVAGNAGVTSDLRLVKRLVDPRGGFTAGTFPVRVMSLDENFLVFNRRRLPRCSDGLTGFHFYGTDVCLNAICAGGTAYLIDFPLTHLSAGRRGSSYRAGRERFLEVWNPRWHGRFVGTSTEMLFVSRHALLRWLLGSSRVRNWVGAASGR